MSINGQCQHFGSVCRLCLCPEDMARWRAYLYLLKIHDELTLSTQVFLVVWVPFPAFPLSWCWFPVQLLTPQPSWLPLRLLPLPLQSPLPLLSPSPPLTAAPQVTSPEKHLLLPAAVCVVRYIRFDMVLRSSPRKRNAFVTTVNIKCNSKMRLQNRAALDNTLQHHQLPCKATNFLSPAVVWKTTRLCAE